MGKKAENLKNNNRQKNLDVPLDSSLGWLAVGDIAFTAWREKKKQHNKEQQNKE